MRILGGARLSHDTDESTSIERQTEQIELTCRARGDTLVHVAEDADVSGAVAPADRAGLGPWLTDPAKMDQWDGLMIAKLDRLTRSILDFVNMIEWCRKYDKTIISIGDSFDLATPTGWLVAHILALFAQFERDRMAERRADAARKARREGRYDGRTLYFGYTVDEHNRYAQSFIYGPMARQMARWRLEGHTLSWIARSLQERGILPRGGADGWKADKVQKILGNPSLAGIITEGIPGEGGKKGHGLKILRGTDGQPLRFTHDHEPWDKDCPLCPILDDDTWSRLQEVMTVKPRGERKGGFMLTRVAYCECGEPLYGNRRPEGRQSYYRCSTGATDHKVWCGARTIPSTELEVEVAARVLRVWGERELYRRTIRPGRDHRAELEAVSRRIADVEAEVVSGILPAASAGRMLASLEAERERLEGLPVEPARDEWEPAGVTVRQHWAGLSGDDEKGHLLKTWGVRAVAWRDGQGIHVGLAHGQPDGYEQATGLLLPHLPGDHEPLYEIAGMLMHRGADGAYVQLRDPEDVAAIGAIRDRLGI